MLPVPALLFATLSASFALSDPQSASPPPILESHAAAGLPDFDIFPAASLKQPIVEAYDIQNAVNVQNHPPVLTWRSPAAQR